jgi:hypothetical protein
MLGSPCSPCCKETCTDAVAFKTWQSLVATPMRCTIAGTIPARDAATSTNMPIVITRPSGGNRAISGSSITRPTSEAFLTDPTIRQGFPGASIGHFNEYTNAKSAQTFGEYDLAVDLTPVGSGGGLYDSDYTQWIGRRDAYIPPVGYVRYVSASASHVVVVTLTVLAEQSESPSIFSRTCKVSAVVDCATFWETAYDVAPLAARLGVTTSTYGTTEIAQLPTDVLYGSSGANIGPQVLQLTCNSGSNSRAARLQGWWQSSLKPQTLTWTKLPEMVATAVLQQGTFGFTGQSRLFFCSVPGQWLPWSPSLPRGALSVYESFWASGLNYQNNGDTVFVNVCSGGISDSEKNYRRAIATTPEYYNTTGVYRNIRGMPSREQVTGGQSFAVFPSPPTDRLTFSVSPS